MSAIYPNYPFRAVLGLPITGFAVIMIGLAEFEMLVRTSQCCSSLYWGRTSEQMGMRRTRADFRVPIPHLKTLEIQNDLACVSSRCASVGKVQIRDDALTVLDEVFYEESDSN